MHAYISPTLLGVATGLRSMSPLAVVALTTSGKPGAAVPRIVARPPVPAVLGAACAAELIADKLPGMPSRLAPPGLAARLVLGALVGGLATRIEGASPALGAACGLLGAGAGAWTGSTIRRQLSMTTHLPDLVFAVLEDAATLALALWAVRAAVDQPLSAPIVRPRMK
ncbi:MAG: DUF4126 family protein [Chloroflexi bacterium]|nr:DUF4126 family protein [Chloroflexota bacterium]